MWDWILVAIEFLLEKINLFNDKKYSFDLLLLGLNYYYVVRISALWFGILLI